MPTLQRLLHHLPQLPRCPPSILCVCRYAVGLPIPRSAPCEQKRTSCSLPRRLARPGGPPSSVPSVTACAVMWGEQSFLEPHLISPSISVFTYRVAVVDASENGLVKLKGARVGSLPPDLHHHRPLSGTHRRGKAIPAFYRAMMRGLTRGLGFISLSLHPVFRQSCAPWHSYIASLRHLLSTCAFPSSSCFATILCLYFILHFFRPA